MPSPREPLWVCDRGNCTGREAAEEFCAAHWAPAVRDIAEWLPMHFRIKDGGWYRLDIVNGCWAVFRAKEVDRASPP